MPDQLLECGDGGDVIVLGPEHAVDIGDDPVDVLLREVVHAPALRQDFAQVEVVVLHPSLLPGRVGVAEEEAPDAALAVRAGLHAADHGELASVVRQRDLEEAPEGLRPQHFL